MAIFNKILSFKKFYLLLILVVLISYGPIIKMLPWQDDNALFFKLSHIQGAAGYLGYGILGQGAYKYTAAYYYPIYLIFGFQTQYYFLLSLIFYFIATLSVNFTAKKIFGTKQGNLAALIFAAGFISSDGFIRLYNSVGTSLSIIFISLLLLNLYQYFRNHKLSNYLLSILFYFLAVEFIRYRTHYLISVVLLIEVLNLFKTKINLAKIFWIFIRLLPFIYIFNKYFISGGDQRSSEISVYIQALLSGNFSILYSYFASISNVITPDWLSARLPVGWKLLAICLLIFILFLSSLKIRKIFILPCLILLFIWYLIERRIFSVAVLNLSPQTHGVVFLGGFDLLLLSTILLSKWKKLKYESLLFAWISLNILGYAAYQPTVAYESANRFFAHSYFAFVLLLGSLAFSVKLPKLTRKLIFSYALIYLSGNLISSIVQQQYLLKYRTEPVRKFYTQLFELKPTTQKGDIFYFDIADNMRGRFRDAFSVAQMPEETALAWRYGNVDRYDIAMATQFDEIEKLINNGFDKTKINSFFYSEQGLINTTSQLYGGISPVVPTKASVEIQASVGDISKLSYPIIGNPELILNPIYKNPELLNLASQYLDYLESLSRVKVSAPNSWRESKPEFVNDRKLSTIWQADRVLWKETGEGSGAILEFDFPQNISLDKLVWINAYENNSPTQIEVEALVNNNWQTVGNYLGNSRVKSEELNILDLDNLSSSKVRFKIISTLNTDSAGISEVWIVPQKFSSLPLVQLDEFVQSPYGYIANEDQLKKILEITDWKGEVQVSFLTNQSSKYQTNEDLNIDIIYDGKVHSYEFLLPAGGTQLQDIKLEPQQSFGIVNIKSIKYTPAISFNE